MRKRVFGAAKFIGDCFTGLVPHKKIGEAVVPMDVYDFANLRHKLGLEYVSAPPPNVKVPAEARVWDLAGKTIYPGFIDAYSRLDLPETLKPEPAPKPEPATAEPGAFV